jgi:hypothetical protein
MSFALSKCGWLTSVQVKGVDYKCRPGGREELRDLSLLDSVALNKRTSSTTSASLSSISALNAPSLTE